MYYNNKSIVSIAHNIVQHEKTIHIKINRSLNIDNLDKGLVVIAEIGDIVLFYNLYKSYF